MGSLFDILLLQGRIWGFALEDTNRTCSRMAFSGFSAVHSSSIVCHRTTLRSRNVCLPFGTVFHSGLTFPIFRPRWLLEQRRPLDAQKSLQYLRGCDESPEAVSQELTDIKENIELHNTIEEAPWHVLFSDRNLFARLWRSAVLQFMAQMCGATAIKYYLPTVFLALGLSKDLSLMAGGIESTLKIGCSVIEMLIIDKLGRRRTLLLGSFIMSVSMLVCSVHFLGYSVQFSRANHHRSTVHCRLHTQAIRTGHQTTPASYSYSSSPLDTPSDLDLMRGCMEPRYEIAFLAFGELD